MTIRGGRADDDRDLPIVASQPSCLRDCCHCESLHPPILVAAGPWGGNNRVFLLFLSMAILVGGIHLGSYASDRLPVRRGVQYVFVILRMPREKVEPVATMHFQSLGHRIPDANPLTAEQSPQLFLGQLPQIRSEHGLA